MNIRDEIKIKIKEKLAERGYGALKKFGDFVGLTPNQVTQILNTDEGKQTRAIKFEEWLRIEQFFAPEKLLDFDAILPPTKRARFIELYDSAAPEFQEILFEIAELLLRQTKRNKKN